MPAQLVCVCVFAFDIIQSTYNIVTVSNRPHDCEYLRVCAGLCELTNVQGWDLVHDTDSQSNGEQIIQPGRRHGHCLKMVTPGYGQPWPGPSTMQDLMHFFTGQQCAVHVAVIVIALLA